MALRPGESPARPGDVTDEVLDAAFLVGFTHSNTHIIDGGRAEENGLEGDVSIFPGSELLGFTPLSIIQD